MRGVIRLTGLFFVVGTVRPRALRRIGLYAQMPTRVYSCAQKYSQLTSFLLHHTLQLLYKDFGYNTLLRATFGLFVVAARRVLTNHASGDKQRCRYRPNTRSIGGESCRHTFPRHLTAAAPPPPQHAVQHSTLRHTPTLCSAQPVTRG